MVVQQFVQFGGEVFVVEQVVDVQVVMCYFVFVCWVDVMIGGVDFGFVVGFFVCLVEGDVIGQDQWIGRIDVQVFVYWYVFFFQFGDFVQQCIWCQYYVIVDQVLYVFVQDV